MMRCILFLPLTALAANLPPPAARPVDFVKDVAPIFAAKCVKCHGPEKQKSGYRLDERKTALIGGESHAPNIVPGKSADSPLIKFVASLDDDLKMPPKGEPLSVEQIGTLRAWIDQGAQWPDSASAKLADPLDWWSLKPPVAALVKARADQLARAYGKSAGALTSAATIDAFISEKLAEKDLAMSPEADARTLCRRLYFDLIGLPPTPEEADAFVEEWGEASVAMSHDDILAKWTDKLLASPRYGEKWARHWLDIVHYGETHGYDKDQPRPNAWPYRDYVIRALNNDKPYARFVQEQIAGDALFPGTEDGITALGFIAAGPWDFIGHVELPESKIDGQIARMLDRDDMVANTLNTFCATTVQCARCHNHKFDPITQEDYYRTTAVFAALDRADKKFDADPNVATQRARLEAAKRHAAATRESLEKELRKLGGDELANVEKLIAEAKDPVSGEERPEFGWHSGIEKKQDAVKWVQIDLGGPVEFERIGFVGCHDNFNNIGAGFGFPVRYKIEVSDDPEFTSNVALLEDKTGEDVPNPGVTSQTVAAPERARFIRITATKLAPRLNDFIFALAEVQVFDKAGHNLALNAKVTSLDSIEAPVRWTRKNLTDGYYYGHKAKLPPGDIAELGKQRSAIVARVLSPELKMELDTATRALADVDAGLAKLPAPRIVYAGTVYNGSGAFCGTGGKPRTIRILARGDVKQPGVEVGPGIVRFIPGVATFDLPPEAAEAERRVALARWLTDDRNPLTWRVIVNRVWQYHFGRGLVDSPNDFGRMGAQPSHPELLDWLAVTFRDDMAGSLKKLHRAIVLSKAWRQTSTPDRQSAFRDQQSDSANTLLWRANRRKLDAEAVRDSILCVAGRLDLTMGGESFKDYVVEKPEHSPHYEYALADVEDPKLWRRAVYRSIVRSQPQPFMSVLDCADPSMSVAKRNESLNALQALALLNDRLAVAMARHFAARVEKSDATTSERITAAVRLALARNPTTDELATLTAVAEKQNLAAACRVIFNLNEFAFVD